ncbi:dTDP-glucose pyrophosphorylase [Sulfitobacter sp. JL08]|uniref:nucleotidyltransferase family protein n=1 Tax=Sulfitobacter sp. JL08 TaxID=2070369 RepID=UPI000E0BA5E6|nr:nucleotidyltransferase family protein [Sulfitobacter sp. JL08]AXI54112.1 dTDP-glucose pyrophosphorylase [Sulfitobacter sp. JL08]
MTDRIAAIVPAAGQGSRLFPFPCPKELFPVGYQDLNVDGTIEKRPKVVSQYLLEHLVEAGAQQVFFILGNGKWDLMRYYGDGSRFDTNISYLFQEELHGMPYAIDLARAWLDGQTVLFGMPDTIIEPSDCFKRLHAFHAEQMADLTLALFPTNNPSKFGMVEMDTEANVIRTIDKPKASKLRYMWGACCWSPAFTGLIGDYLHATEYSGKEVVLGDIFNYALELKLTVKGLIFEDGKYIDIGTSTDLNSALKKFQL